MAVIILALVLGLYVGLIVYKQRLNSSSPTGLAGIDNQLADLEKSRNKATEIEILNLRKQLSVINPLLSAHLFWSEALTTIQNATQSQVQFQSLNADVPGKKIVIKILAANYTTVARQIASFYSVDSITDVILSKVQSQPTGKLDVSMQLSFDTVKLLNKISGEK